MVRRPPEYFVDLETGEALRRVDHKSLDGTDRFCAGCTDDGRGREFGRWLTRAPGKVDPGQGRSDDGDSERDYPSDDFEIHVTTYRYSGAERSTRDKTQTSLPAR